MKQRVITGAFISLAYILAIVGTIYWNTIVFDVLTLFLMIATGWEMSNCLANKTSAPLKPMLIFTVVASYSVFKVVNIYTELSIAVSAFFATALLMAFVSFLICVFSNKLVVGNAVSTAFAIIYPVSILACFLALAYLPDNMYAGAIIMVIISTCFADTFAYLVGSALKGPKLCPNVSPKKTVSGAIGGLLGGVLAGILLFCAAQFGILKVEQFSSSVAVNIVNWVFMGLGSALFCEIGDLIASYVKRVCGIKDFGSVLAGHGGFMDRIDGLIVSSIYLYTYYSILILVL